MHKKVLGLALYKKINNIYKKKGNKGCTQLGSGMFAQSSWWNIDICIQTNAQLLKLVINKNIFIVYLSVLHLDF